MGSPPDKYRNRSRYRGDAYMVSCHLLQTCTRDCHSCIRHPRESSGQDTQNAKFSRRTISGRVSIMSAGYSQPCLLYGPAICQPGQMEAAIAVPTPSRSERSRSRPTSSGVGAAHVLPSRQTLPYSRRSRRFHKATLPHARLTSAL